MGFHANPGEDAGVPRRARRAGAWTATAGWHGIDWRHGGDLTATLDVSPFFYENLSLPPQSMMEVGFVAVGSRSLSSLAGSLWFLDGGHPPASRWGAADGVMVASPVASDLRSDCPLLSPNHRTPTRWHTGTAHCHGCRKLSFSRWPTTSTRAATYFVPGPFPIVWCVCVNRGRHRFCWTLFFSALFSSHTLLVLCSSHLFSSPFLPFPFLSPQSCSTQSPPNSSGPLEAGVQKRHRHFRCTAELRIHTCTPCPADRFGVDGACTHSGVFETVKQSKLGSVSPVARDLGPLSMAN